MSSGSFVDLSRLVDNGVDLSAGVRLRPFVPKIVTARDQTRLLSPQRRYMQLTRDDTTLVWE